MSQVSTEAFDFIFATKNKLEGRADRLEARVDRAQEKLDDLLEGGELSTSQERRAGRLEGLIAARTGRLVALEADIAEYEAFPLPQDDAIINYNAEEGTFGVTLQESPYDDLFGPGEYVRVGMRGFNDEGRARGTSTQLVLNHPDYVGDKYILGDSTFSYDGLRIQDYSKYDNVEIYISVDGVDVQTLTLV